MWENEKDNGNTFDSTKRADVADDEPNDVSFQRLYQTLCCMGSALNVLGIKEIEDRGSRRGGRGLSLRNVVLLGLEFLPMGTVLRDQMLLE